MMTAQTIPTVALSELEGVCEDCERVRIWRGELGGISAWCSEGGGGGFLLVVVRGDYHAFW